MQDSTSLVALIVDSDGVAREYIKNKLTKHSIECHEADDGLAALENLERHDIDFIVSDVQMKKIDGIQFIGIVQRNHKIPVVATTKRSNEEVIIEAFRAGANNVIRKPDKLDELENIILPLTKLIQKSKSQVFDYRTIRCFAEELIIENDTSQIPVIVEHLLSLIKDTHFAGRMDGLEVGLYEMIANAIEHGNLAINNQEKEDALSKNRFKELVESRLINPEYSERSVCVNLNYRPEQLTITITDEGSGFDYKGFSTAAPKGNVLAHCGRGILLTKVYCDEVSYNKVGNQVKLILKSNINLEKAL